MPRPVCKRGGHGGNNRAHRSGRCGSLSAGWEVGDSEDKTVRRGAHCRWHPHSIRRLPMRLDSYWAGAAGARGAGKRLGWA
eukprot:1187647-Prorocentrum_minimum.AAC.5